jgi:hypothetical protein
MENSDKIVLGIVVGFGTLLLLVPWVVGKFVKEKDE